MEKFVFLTDLHWGYERVGGHRKPLHDTRALTIALDFIKDFEPDHVILGGDMLDCGPISHHNDRKPGRTEGLRIFADAKELRSALLAPLEALQGTTLTYIVGNHEDWLNDLIAAQPGLSGVVNPEVILGLDQWKVIPNGGYHRLGKIVFCHGDQLRGGENIAKQAVVDHEKNIRFGHMHTYQAFTKVTPVDATGHTGIAVPCLCRKGPGYAGGKPNKWVQGFQWGYIGGPGGSFCDYTTIITNGSAMIEGKHYRG